MPQDFPYLAGVAADVQVGLALEPLCLHCIVGFLEKGGSSSESTDQSIHSLYNGVLLQPEGKATDSGFLLTFKWR